MEISIVSWSKENPKTAISPLELLSMPPESSLQLKQNGLKQLILLQDPQIPQEAKDKLSLLLEKDYDSIVSKSPMDVGRINLFQREAHT